MEAAVVFTHNSRRCSQSEVSSQTSSCSREKFSGNDMGSSDVRKLPIQSSAQKQRSWSAYFSLAERLDKPTAPQTTPSANLRIFESLSQSLRKSISETSCRVSFLLPKRSLIEPEPLAAIPFIISAIINETSSNMFSMGNN